MLRSDPKEKKIAKRKKQNKPLDDFYSAEQKHREEIEKTEQEIFEHLKNHTKKVLKKQ